MRLVQVISATAWTEVEDARVRLPYTSSCVPVGSKQSRSISLSLPLSLPRFAAGGTVPPKATRKPSVGTSSVGGLSGASRVGDADGSALYSTAASAVTAVEFACGGRVLVSLHANGMVTATNTDYTHRQHHFRGDTELLSDGRIGSDHDRERGHGQDRAVSYLTAVVCPPSSSSGGDGTGETLSHLIATPCSIGCGDSLIAVSRGCTVRVFRLSIPLPAGTADLNATYSSTLNTSSSLPSVTFTSCFSLNSNALSEVPPSDPTIPDGPGRLNLSAERYEAEDDIKYVLPVYASRRTQYSRPLTPVRLSLLLTEGTETGTESGSGDKGMELSVCAVCRQDDDIDFDFSPPSDRTHPPQLQLYCGTFLLEREFSVLIPTPLPMHPTLNMGSDVTACSLLGADGCFVVPEGIFLLDLRSACCRAKRRRELDELVDSSEAAFSVVRKRELLKLQVNQNKAHELNQKLNS